MYPMGHDLRHGREREAVSCEGRYEDRKEVLCQNPSRRRVRAEFLSIGAAQTKVDLLGDPLPEGAIVRCGTVRFLPRFSAWAVAFSPDGKTVAVGNIPGSWPSECVELWNTATARRIAMLAAGSFNILALAWSPDGRKLAVGHDRRLEIFDAFKGTVLATLPQPKPSSHCNWSICWSSDGQQLASQSTDGEICVWNVVSASIAGRLIVA